MMYLSLRLHVVLPSILLFPVDSPRNSNLNHHPPFQRLFLEDDVGRGEDDDGRGEDDVGRGEDDDGRGEKVVSTSNRNFVAEPAAAALSEAVAVAGASAPCSSALGAFLQGDFAQSLGFVVDYIHAGTFDVAKELDLTHAREAVALLPRNDDHHLLHQKQVRSEPSDLSAGASALEQLILFMYGILYLLCARHHLCCLLTRSLPAALNCRSRSRLPLRLDTGTKGDASGGKVDVVGLNEVVVFVKSPVSRLCSDEEEWNSVMSRVRPQIQHLLDL
jgi:hypothetical protein